MAEKQQKNPKDEDIDEEIDPNDPDGDEDDDDDDDDDLDDDDKVVKIKQGRMTQLMTREKKLGIKQGRKAVLKELGFDTLDAAKAKLGKSETTGNEPDEKQKEQQRTQDAETAKVQHEAKISKAESLLTRRLTMAKVDPNKLDAAIKILDAEEHIESDADEVDAAIEELQEKMPEFFSKDDDDDEDGDKPKSKTTKRPARKSTPGGAPRKKGEASPADRAKDRLQRRHGSKIAANKQ